MNQKKKVIIRLGNHIKNTSVARHYALELEELQSIADIEQLWTETEEEFIEKAQEAEAVITSWGFHMNRNIISKLKNLRIISVGGVGVDMVDLEAATDHGVVVTNVPDIFIEEVADHTLMLLLGMARRVKEQMQLAKENWNQGRGALAQVSRLRGQTLGLFSFGSIARCVAQRAKAFGFQILTHDPYVSELKIAEAGVESVTFGELLERSDFFSIHSPLNEETRGILSTAEFEKMKNTAIVINAGRGPVIDEAALIHALQEGQIAGAGLDVLETEPPQPENPLLHMSNVIITPHTAAQSSRVRRTIRRRVDQEIRLVFSGKWPMSCVNPTVLPKTNLVRWQPYSMDRGPNR